MLEDSAFLIPTYIRNLQMLMMFVSFNQQNQPLVSYFYLQLQQSNPRPRACSLSVLTLLFFWYVSDKFKFIQLETQHAGKFMTTTTCAHDLNFILIFHFLHFFLSFKLNYNPCSNTKPSISGIHYVYYQYFQNRNIGNYTITDFPLQRLAIQFLSPFYQVSRWFMLPQGDQIH